MQQHIALRLVPYSLCTPLFCLMFLNFQIKHDYVVSFSLQETAVLETQSSLETIETTDLETPKTQILPQV